MKNKKTTQEFNEKMESIAAFSNITVEQLMKLPSHIYIVIANNFYTSKEKK
jgi:hypothetical protein